MRILSAGSKYLLPLTVAALLVIAPAVQAQPALVHDDGSPGVATTGGPPEPVGFPWRWASSLSKGSSTLVQGNTYDIFACFQYSTATRLFAQGINGKWSGVYVTATPKRSKACSAGAPWLMHYQYKAGQPGPSATPGGPGIVNMATGYTAPKYKFPVGVWANWQACSNAHWNDCS
jgi:hypothetical protein